MSNFKVPPLSVPTRDITYANSTFQNLTTPKVGQLMLEPFSPQVQQPSLIINQNRNRAPPQKQLLNQQYPLVPFQSLHKETFADRLNTIAPFAFIQRYTFPTMTVYQVQQAWNTYLTTFHLLIDEALSLTPHLDNERLVEAVESYLIMVGAKRIGIA